MGATRGVLVTDPALAGSDWLSTVRVLAAAVRELEFDLLLAGVDTSDGGAGLGAGRPRGAARAAVPLERGVDRADRWRRRASGASRRPASRRSRHRRPALIGCTQALGRAALSDAQGDHGRPVEGGRRSDAGRPRSRCRDRGRRGGRDPGRGRAPAAGARRDARRAWPAADAAREVVDFLAIPRARLMAGAIWVVGQPGAVGRPDAAVGARSRRSRERSARPAAGTVVGDRRRGRIRGRGGRAGAATCRGSSPSPSRR